MGKHRSGHSYQEFPILNVARRCGLVLNDRTLEWEEVEASCPFCGDHGPGKHHLFLNTTRNIFRCVLCGEKGNSVSLYAKMEGVSNRQAFRALSEDSVLYRFPQQPLSQKPAEREPSSLAVRHNVYYDMAPDRFSNERVGDVPARPPQSMAFLRLGLYMINRVVY